MFRQRFTQFSIDDLGGVLLHIRDNVTIFVEGHNDTRMPCPLRNNFNGYTLHKELRDMAMAKSVDADMWNV